MDARLHDPTALAWIVVVAYAVGGLVAFGAAQSTSDARERAFWIGASALLLLLGINKQLDLQTLVLDLVRDSARAHGWYQSRRLVQGAFLLALGFGSIVAAAALLIWLVGAVPTIRAAAMGVLLLGTFIVLRAASFHHIDQWVRVDVAGLRSGWWLELIGTGLIASAAAVFRHRQSVGENT